MGHRKKPNGLSEHQREQFVRDAVAFADKLRDLSHNIRTTCPDYRPLSDLYEQNAAAIRAISGKELPWISYTTGKAT